MTLKRNPASIAIQPTHAGIFHISVKIIWRKCLDRHVLPIMAAIGSAFNLENKVPIRAAICPQDPTCFRIDEFHRVDARGRRKRRSYIAPVLPVAAGPIKAAADQDPPFRSGCKAKALDFLRCLSGSSFFRQCPGEGLAGIPKELGRVGGAKRRETQSQKNKPKQDFANAVLE